MNDLIETDEPRLDAGIDRPDEIEAVDVIAGVEGVILKAMFARELAETQMEESEPVDVPGNPTDEGADELEAKLEESGVDAILSTSNPPLDLAGETEGGMETKLEQSGLYSNFFIANQNPPEFDQIKYGTQLNLADWQEVMAHRELIGGVQNEYLRNVAQKPEYFPKRFSDPNYLPQSPILLLSEAWSSARRYARCCMKKGKNPVPCRLHKYCPYCCWWVRNNAWLTFVPVFDEGNWFFVTGSFTGELTKDWDCDVYSWLDYWNAYKIGFQNWISNQHVNGVYWTEELAVRLFLPTRVLPHVHAIVEAGCLEEADLRALEASVNQHLDTVLGDHLPANIEVKPIQSARHLMDCIRYMYKPLNILKAYERTWPVASFHNRYLAQTLNSQAADLVLGYSLVTTDRCKMNGKGNLNAKARNFIGVRKDNHHRYRRQLAEVKAQAKDLYIEIEPENYN